MVAGSGHGVVGQVVVLLSVSHLVVERMMKLGGLAGSHVRLLHLLDLLGLVLDDYGRLRNVYALSFQLLL